MKQYIQLMNEINLPKNSEEFIELHEKAYAQALNTFKLSALGDSSEVFREKLQVSIFKNNFYENQFFNKFLFFKKRNKLMIN